MSMPNENIHDVVTLLLSSFPNLSCNHRQCQSGTCLQVPNPSNNNLKIEKCFCKRNFYGNNCEYESWASRSFPDEPINPNQPSGSLTLQEMLKGFEGLYKYLANLGCLVLFVTITLAFIAGVIYGRHRYSQSENYLAGLNQPLITRPNTPGLVPAGVPGFSGLSRHASVSNSPKRNPYPIKSRCSSRNSPVRKAKEKGQDNNSNYNSNLSRPISKNSGLQVSSSNDITSTQSHSTQVEHLPVSSRTSLATRKSISKAMSTLRRPSHLIADTIDAIRRTSSTMMQNNGRYTSIDHHYKGASNFSSPNGNIARIDESLVADIEENMATCPIVTYSNINHHSHASHVISYDQKRPLLESKSSNLDQRFLDSLQDGGINSINGGIRRRTSFPCSRKPSEVDETFEKEIDLDNHNATDTRIYVDNEVGGGEDFVCF